MAKHVDPVKLATLANILSGIDFDVAMESVENNMVREFGDDGPWVLLIEADLVEALARTADQEVTKQAIAWAATEEWQADEGRPDDLADLLGELSSLAKRAMDEGKQMYVLIGL